MTRSTKVADTTREDRIRIVSACGIDKYYQPYIDGECELAELNMRNAARSYISEGQREPAGPSCPM